MHLSDEQLLSQNDMNHEHLFQCSACAKRYQNIHQTRSTLRVLSNRKLMNDQKNLSLKEQSLWLDIQESAKEQQLLNHRDKDKKAINIKWRYVSTALAASLFLFSLFSLHYMSSISEDVNEQQIALMQLIQENNELQEKLFSIVATLNTEVEPHKKMHVMTSINNHDLAIQQAYLENKSEIEKLLLWQERKRILTKFDVSLASKNIEI